MYVHTTLLTNWQTRVAEHLRVRLQALLLLVLRLLLVLLVLLLLLNGHIILKE